MTSRSLALNCVLAASIACVSLLSTDVAASHEMHRQLNTAASKLAAQRPEQMNSIRAGDIVDERERQRVSMAIQSSRLYEHHRDADPQRSTPVNTLGRL